MSNGTDPALRLVTTATIDAIGVGRSVFTDLTMLDIGRATADTSRVDLAVANLVADVLALAQVRSLDDFLTFCVPGETTSSSWPRPC